MRSELGAAVSAAYLSQLETGRRHHLTAATRALLARFYKVHPGYLVGDPPGFETTIRTDALRERPDLGAWLAERAEDWRDDPLLHDLFARLAQREDPRRDLLMLAALLEQEASAPGGRWGRGASPAPAAVAVGGDD